MRIEGLEVERFGVWSGLELNDLPDALAVVYGPNEAGKTTLLEFLRAVLFGFTPHQRQLALCGGAGRGGGTLHVTHRGRKYRLARHVGADPDGEQCELTTADGRPCSEYELSELLGGVSDEVFRSVFAVGLRQLQALAVLTDTEAADLLLATSAGLGPAPLRRVFDQLDRARQRLIGNDRAGGQIGHLLGRQRELQEQIDRAAGRLQQYGQLLQTKRELDRRIERLTERYRTLSQHQRLLTLAGTVADRWRTLKQIERQLELLGEPKAIRQELREEIELLQAALEKRDRIEQAIQARVSRLKEQLDGLAVNQTLRRLGPRIEALSEQASWIDQLQQRLQELEAEIHTLEAELASQKNDLGLGASASGRGATGYRLPGVVLGKLTGSPGADRASPSADPVVQESLRRLRRSARRVSQRRQQLQQAERRLAQAQQTAEMLSVQLQTGLQAMGTSSLKKATAEASQLLAQLRRHEHLEDRLAQLEELESELQQQNRYLLDRQVLPVGVLLGVGAVFVASVVLAMAGLFMPKSITGSFGWLMSLGGGLGLVAAVLTKLALERSYAHRLEACQQQLHGLRRQLEQVNEDRRQLAHVCPVEEGTLSARIAEAEQQLAQLESFAPLEAERKAAEREAREASQQIAELKPALQRAESAWREALKRLGLPENLTFRQVRGLLEQSGTWQQVQQRLEQCYQAYEQTQHSLDQLQQRAEQVASQLQIDTQGYSPSELVGVLAGKWREEQGRWKTRRRLRQRLRLLQQRSTANRVATRRLRQRFHRLLRRCGVSGREELDAIAGHWEQAEQLRRQRDQLHREIETALAGQCGWEEIENHLNEHSPERIGDQTQQIDRELEQVRAKLHEISEKRGRVSEQLAAVGNDRQATVAAFQLCQVREELRQQVHQWQVLAATTELLRRAKQGFEQRYQPETLRLASEYFEQLTAGRYGRIWAPLEGSSLFVDTRRGETFSAEELSEGTREQLFICLRLALAQRYAQAGTKLPLVLDDVLANFDNRRTKLAAELLRNLAQQDQQILLFTCHAHTARLFARLDVPVLRLPRRRKSHGKRRRRRPAVLRPQRNRPTHSPVETSPACKGNKPAAVPPAESPTAALPVNSPLAEPQDRPREHSTDSFSGSGDRPLSVDLAPAADADGCRFDWSPVDVLSLGSLGGSDHGAEVLDVYPDPEQLDPMRLVTPCDTVSLPAEVSEPFAYGSLHGDLLPPDAALSVLGGNVEQEFSHAVPAEAEPRWTAAQQWPPFPTASQSVPYGQPTEAHPTAAQPSEPNAKLAELRAAVLGELAWKKRERTDGTKTGRSPDAEEPRVPIPRVDYYGDQASYDNKGNRIAPEPFELRDRKLILSADDMDEVPQSGISNGAFGEENDVSGLQASPSYEEPNAGDLEQPGHGADDRFGEAA